MELEHDDFVVRYDSSKITVPELLDVCDKSGFPGSIVGAPSEDSNSPSKPFQELPIVYEEAISTASKENKPIVLEFGAKWCLPCQRMEKETFADERVKTLLGQCVLVKIDADEQAALIAKFGVTGLPDVRLLSPDGVELKRIVDFQDAESFSQELQWLLTRVP